MAGYRSGRGLASATVALVGAVAVLAVLEALVWYAIRHAEPAYTEGVIVLFPIVLLRGLEAIVELAAAIVFVCWVFRAVANLPSLGATAPRFSPAVALWSLLVPFV